VKLEITSETTYGQQCIEKSLFAYKKQLIDHYIVSSVWKVL